MEQLRRRAALLRLIQLAGNPAQIVPEREPQAGQENQRQGPAEQEPAVRGPAAAQAEPGRADFLEGLSFGKRGLRFRADYIRGRSMKTDITVRSDGTVTLTTWGRGEAALRWLDRLKGKKLMELV